MSNAPLVNSMTYWDGRFGSGDWQIKGGFSQTRAFAESQVTILDIESSFSGTLCDFGCGAGDAFPTYRQAFPAARLVGVDFSLEAIALCQNRYSDIAEFFCGTTDAVPKCDIIICSNVLEHVDDDEAVVSSLLKRCRKLFAIVPYREAPLSLEHLRQYSERSFHNLQPAEVCIFKSKGWGLSGFSAIWQIYIKNIFRFMVCRPTISNGRQIMFVFNGVA